MLFTNARRALRSAVRTTIESLEDRRLLATASIGTPSFGGRITSQTVPVTLGPPNVPTLTANNFVLQNLNYPDLSEVTAKGISQVGSAATFTVSASGDPIKSGWYDAYVRHTSLPGGESHANFAFLNGDFDGDGSVSINDFNILNDEHNFGHSNKTYADGDADYDGGVSVNDYNLMAANFGKSIPAPPTVAGGLSVAAVQDFALDLFWDALDNGPRNGFKVYRSDDNGANYAMVKSIPDPDETYWRDEGLTAGKKYYYRVRAYTNDGGAQASVTRTAGTPIDSPPQPSGLWAEGIGNHSIWVEWEPATNKPVAQYYVYRGTTPTYNTNTYTLAGTVDASLTQFTDINRDIGVTYYYTVIAKGTNGKFSLPLPPDAATVENEAPVITSGNDVTTTTKEATVAVTATDDGYADPLAYAWSVVSKPDGADDPDFQDASAASTDVTFSKAGYYELGVAVSDGVSSTDYTVSVDVQQTADDVTVTPSSKTMKVGARQQFAASAEDQFGHAIEDAVVQWSAWGSIDADGLYTAPAMAEDVIHATIGGKTGEAQIDITVPAPLNVTATLANKKDVNIEWVDGSDVEAGYNVQYSTDNGQTFQTFVTTPPNATGWSMRNLTPDSNYLFRVMTVTGSPDDQDAVDEATQFKTPRVFDPVFEWSYAGAPTPGTSGYDPKGQQGPFYDGHDHATLHVSNLPPNETMQIRINPGFEGSWDGTWDGSPDDPHDPEEHVDDGPIGPDYWSAHGPGVSINGAFSNQHPDIDTTYTGPWTFTFNTGPNGTADYTFESDTTTSNSIEWREHPETDEFWNIFVDVKPVPVTEVSINAEDDVAKEVSFGETKVLDNQLIYNVTRTPLPIEATGNAEQDDAKRYPGNLTVKFHPPAGTAVLGEDYTGLIDQSVVIPAGEGSARVTFVAADDSVPDPDESFKLCIKADSNYLLEGFVAGGEIHDVSLDLDVDSNNDTHIDLVNTDKGTDDPFEANGLGKVMKVNDDDTDEDGIPDFADGYDPHGAFPTTSDNNAVGGESFTPMSLTLPAGIDYANATLKLDYFASVPNSVTRTGDGTEDSPYVYTPFRGRFRVWTKDGYDHRDGADVKNGGDFIMGDQSYTADELGLRNGGTLNLFIEGIRAATDELPEITAHLTIGDDFYQDPIQVTVAPNMISADANRDGMIDFDGSDHGKTEFWLNNNFDRTVKTGNFTATADVTHRLAPAGMPVHRSGPTIVDPVALSDFKFDTIHNSRDLQDFIRIDINVPTFVKQDNSQHLELHTPNSLTAMKFFTVSDFEAAGYLKDMGAEASIMAGRKAMRPSGLADPLSTGSVYEINDDIVHSTDRFSLLLEADDGRGINTSLRNSPIELRITNDNGKVITKDSIVIDFQDISQMFEEWTVGTGSGHRDLRQPGTPSIPKVATSIGGPSTPSERDKFDNQYILFVHGWRLEEGERQEEARTSYKRLFHELYKGRFGLFSWPTEFVDAANPLKFLGTPFGRDNFNQSELVAWNSAPALNDLLEQLDSYYGQEKVSMFAHSLGNVVASEALRLTADAPDHHKLVKTYVATNAAIAAEAYSADVASDAEYDLATAKYGPSSLISNNYPDQSWHFENVGVRTADIYSDFPLHSNFPALGPSGGPIFGGIGDVTDSIYNFYFPGDFATNNPIVWPLNAALKPFGPLTGFTYKYTGTRVIGQDYTGKQVVTDWNRDGHFERDNGGVLNLDTDAGRYEALSFAAQPRTRALGALNVTGGAFANTAGSQVDLRGIFNRPVDIDYAVNDNSLNHSYQFSNSNAFANPYWAALKSRLL